MTIKQKVYSAALAILKDKMIFSQSLLNELAHGAENASKSSAGDKHETGRAMVQLEQEKIGNQLLELEAMYNELQKLEHQKTSSTISKGSLIETSSGLFYLSIGLGKVIIENETIFLLSPQSPFGKQLVGLKKDDVVLFNGKESKINRID
jgi:hypothetical protein